jgi:hypothetical protein
VLEIEKDMMGGNCRTYERDEECIKNLEHFGKRRCIIYEKIILKLIRKE